jgi:hypothetical protein
MGELRKKEGNSQSNSERRGYGQPSKQGRAGRRKKRKKN